jgi:hypothetical protein
MCRSGPFDTFVMSTTTNSVISSLNDLLRVFRNVGIENSGVSKSPKRKNTTFKTGCEFEIKNVPLV